MLCLILSLLVLSLALKYILPIRLCSIKRQYTQFLICLETWEAFWIYLLWLSHFSSSIIMNRSFYTSLLKSCLRSRIILRVFGFCCVWEVSSRSAANAPSSAVFLQKTRMFKWLKNARRRLVTNLTFMNLLLRSGSLKPLLKTSLFYRIMSR